MTPDSGPLAPRADAEDRSRSERTTLSQALLEPVRQRRPVEAAADYDELRVLGQLLAARHVQTAEQIIQALDAAAVEPIRTQITDAMKVYERGVLHDVTWHP